VLPMMEGNSTPHSQPGREQPPTYRGRPTARGPSSNGRRGHYARPTHRQIKRDFASVTGTNARSRYINATDNHRCHRRTEYLVQAGCCPRIRQYSGARSPQLTPTGSSVIALPELGTRHRT
jgi:hypothetical protein